VRDIDAGGKLTETFAFAREGTMLNIDRAYIAAALVLLLLGELLGLYMGIANDTKLLSLHVAFLLPGFATLAIYGALFRLWPAMKKGTLAAAQFWLAIVAELALLVGAYQYATSGAVPVAAAGSILTILGVLLILYLFWTRSAEA
jgi:hypothetical protein